MGVLVKNQMGEHPPDRSTPEDSSESSSDSSSTSSSDEEPEPQQTPPTRQNTPQQPTTTVDQRGPGLTSGPQRETSQPSRPTITNESRAQDRSRSPRAVHLRALHVGNLKASQGENANDVYVAQLTKKGKKGDKEYDPAFT